MEDAVLNAENIYWLGGQNLKMGPSVESGVIVVGQKTSKWLKENWNQKNFILIPAQHPVTRLYVEH